MVDDKAYGDRVSGMGAEELRAEIARPHRLLISRDDAPSGRIDMAWAPFDPVNREARIAIIGITPGREQMDTALDAYRRLRQTGQDHAQAAATAKARASFSGGMRTTLVRLLHEIGVQGHLGIRDCARLWHEANHLVHFSSVLRWPVFVEGQNYTGHKPKITARPLFRTVIEQTLVSEIRQHPADCLIAPLGRQALLGLEQAIAALPGFDRRRLLAGLPHPSGAARDQSSQFLGDPPSPGRTKPLNPAYRADALRLRAQVAGLA